MQHSFNQRDLPEDNEARRMDGGWDEAQGHRGKTFGVHGTVLAEDIYVSNISGVPKLV